MPTPRPLPPRATDVRRRAPRRAALAALVLVVGVPAARADAQAACAAGSVASYAAAGFSCRIGGYVLFNFRLDAQASAAGGAEVLGVDPLAAVITPFVGADASGRTTFGLDLANFTTAAGAHGTTHGLERSEAEGVLGFWLAPDRPDVRIAEARVHGAFDGFNATTGRLLVESTVGGIVEELSGTTECLAAWLTEPGGVVGDVAVGGACPELLDGRIAVIAATQSLATREFDDTAPLDGFSAGSLTRIEFTQSVVPEPATVTLVAAGLASLLGVARVRSRTRRAESNPSDGAPTG